MFQGLNDSDIEGREWPVSCTSYLILMKCQWGNSDGLVCISGYRILGSYLKVTRSAGCVLWFQLCT